MWVLYAVAEPGQRKADAALAVQSSAVVVGQCHQLRWTGIFGPQVVRCCLGRISLGMLQGSFGPL